MVGCREDYLLFFAFFLAVFLAVFLTAFFFAFFFFTIRTSFGLCVVRVGKPDADGLRNGQLCVEKATIDSSQ